MNAELSLKICLLALFELIITCGLVSCNDQSSTPHETQVSDQTNNPVQTLYGQHCAQCHGQNAQGNSDIEAPNLAILPKWYMRMQLSSFQNGHRGYDKDDASGKLMQEALKKVDSALLENIINEINEFTPEKSKLTIKGDPIKGEELYRENCMQCHRFNGQGEQAFLSAPLAGQHGWYLTKQLEKFKSGHRGGMKGDTAGNKMANIMDHPYPDADLKDIISFLSTLDHNAPKEERK